MSNYLYLILNLGSLSIPLLYSIFEKKFHFIQYSKAIFWSIIVVAMPFLVWDAIFTNNAIWGFNSDYYLGLKILKMPFEEWLFFFCIPFACLFTHEGFRFYFPQFKISSRVAKTVSIVLIGGISTLLFLHFGKWYTTINFSLFILLILYGFRYKIESLQRYYPIFLLILIPFLLVNGILTGSFIAEPVVWYNDNENLGFRIFTIPFEDIFYAFNMLFSVQLIFNTLKKKFYAKQ